eukprot:scaffold69835_cov102-Phaeocystis_antarctica.AAC.1
MKGAWQVWGSSPVRAAPPAPAWSHCLQGRRARACPRARRRDLYGQTSALAQGRVLTVLECLRRWESLAGCGDAGGVRWVAGGPHCPQCLRPS